MIDSTATIQNIRNKLETLIAVYQVAADWEQSEDTISYYIYKNRSKKVPQRILRITDHRPTLQKYVRPDAPLPSEEIHSNISIEFFTKKYDEDGSRIPNKFKKNVVVPDRVSDVKPFSVDSYKYMSDRLENADVGDIYNAILQWLFNPNRNARYKDPFVNTYKAARVKTKTADLRFPRPTEKVPQNISVDRNGNYVSANAWGADYVTEDNNRTKSEYNMNKKLIRLTEQDLHRIVKESIRNTLEKDLNGNAIYDLGHGYTTSDLYGLERMITGSVLLIIFRE